MLFCICVNDKTFKPLSELRKIKICGVRDVLDFLVLTGICVNDKTFKPLSELRKLRFAELLIFLMVKKKCSQTFPVQFFYSLKKNPNPILFSIFFENGKKNLDWPKSQPKSISKKGYKGSTKTSKIK